MRKMTWSVHHHVLNFKCSFFHSFSCPLFPPKKVAARNTSRSKAISDDSAALRTKTGPRKVGDVVTPPVAWANSRSLSRGRAGTNCTAGLPRDVLGRHGQTTAAGIYRIGREGLTFRALRISQLRTLSRRVTT